MLRSVGALSFGFFSDRYGRKWPMMVCLGLFVALELGSGFCQNLQQFIAIRALFGIVMGGKPLNSIPIYTSTNPYRTRWPCSSDSTGGSPLRRSRCSLRIIPLCLRHRLPPCRCLLSCACSYNAERMAKSVLVWRRPAHRHHGFPLLGA
jgi:hypothetical protein